MYAGANMGHPSREEGFVVCSGLLLVDDYADLRYNHEGRFPVRVCAPLRIFCRSFSLAKEHSI